MTGGKTPRDFGDGKCHNCGKQFTKRTPWQKFCKPECHNEFHRSGGQAFARLIKEQEEMRAAIKELQERSLEQQELIESLNWGGDD